MRIPFAFRHPWRAALMTWKVWKVHRLRQRIARMNPRDRAERRQAERLLGKHRSPSKRGRRAPIRL